MPLKICIRPPPYPSFHSIFLVLVLAHVPSTAQPSLLGASFTSKIVLSSSDLILSSLKNLLSILASSPSNFSIGFGVSASRTKWLSQLGQYSSAFSNCSASLRKTLRHFLQANVYCVFELLEYVAFVQEKKD